MARETTISILVADVVITHRKVQVPTTCPHCEQDLTTPSSDGELTCLVDTLDETAAHSAIVVGTHEDGVAGTSEETLELEQFETEGSDEVAVLDVRCDGCHKSVLTDPGTMQQIMPEGVTIN